MTAPPRAKYSSPVKCAGWEFWEKTSYSFEYFKGTKALHKHSNAALWLACTDNFHTKSTTLPPLFPPIKPPEMLSWQGNPTEVCSKQGKYVRNSPPFHLQNSLEGFLVQTGSQPAVYLVQHIAIQKKLDSWKLAVKGFLNGTLFIYSSSFLCRLEAD